MTPQEWERRRSKIHERFYEDLVGTIECGAFDGGCVIVAKALQEVIGGEIVVLISNEGRAEHAAIKHDEMLWDYDGPLPYPDFIKRFNETEMFASPYSCIGFRNYRKSDLIEACHDEELVERLANLFRQAMPEYSTAKSLIR